ncbi:DUF4249 domain-containing protein [Chryseolinea sp. T2]|uniref:DUF4249 domain-containing protein n=1 Tax=Chryseolinea sp. T2 TaxID=3129255 RepID=UPI003077F43E
MRNRIVVLACLAILASCLDPYIPPIKPGDVNILVIDGSLDATDGTASVVLSRAVTLDQPDEFPSVRGAFVAIEDGNGNTYPLVEGDSGTYKIAAVPIDDKAHYRLHVITSARDEYYSEFVDPLPTPEIDSITYIVDESKLTVRVNTHDDSNQAKYFRWTFDETWNYHAGLLSQYIVIGKGQLRFRTPDEMIYYCWNTKPSYDIVATSTTRLSKSVVSQFPVQYITAGSLKLQMRYSILLKQRTISEDEYEYLEQLRKTTESIGGLFDPQPTAVTGNINRVMPASPVALGYFSVGRTTSKRFYINASDLPKVYREIYPPLGCIPPDTVCGMAGNGCAMTIADLRPGDILGTAAVKGYVLTSTRCADCRVEGGVTTKPDFWED